MSQDYTENGMRHVDTFNSNMVRIDPTHQNFSWRKTHFLTMLKISLVNMWIIYCWIKKKNFIQRQVLESFKEELKKKFQESYEERQKEKKINQKRKRNEYMKQFMAKKRKTQRKQGK